MNNQQKIILGLGTVGAIALAFLYSKKVQASPPINPIPDPTVPIPPINPIIPPVLELQYYQNPYGYGITPLMSILNINGIPFLEVGKELIPGSSQTAYAVTLHTPIITTTVPDVYIDWKNIDLIGLMRVFGANSITLTWILRFIEPDGTETIFRSNGAPNQTRLYSYTSYNRSSLPDNNMINKINMHRADSTTIFYVDKPLMGLLHLDIMGGAQTTIGGANILIKNLMAKE